MKDKNWMERLKSIDDSITNEAKAIQEIISVLIFEPVIEFQLKKHIPEIPDNIFNKQGNQGRGILLRLIRSGFH
jgi:hypothetical protein